MDGTDMKYLKNGYVEFNKLVIFKLEHAIWDVVVKHEDTVKLTIND